VKNSTKALRVKCVDNCHAENVLEEGKIYDVVSEFCGRDYILRGVNSSWEKGRFVEVLDDQPVAEPHKFAVGDKVKIVKKVTIGDASKHFFSWSDMMDNTVGTTVNVIEDTTEEYGTYCLSNGWYYLPESLELVQDELIEESVEDPIKAMPSIDSHYNFEYILKESDHEAGVIKIDPYFVAKQWRLGDKDSSGVIFHIMKSCARFGEKNSKEREILAIYKSIKRLAELEGVYLD
jgi:hypothetical protein